MGAWRFFGPSIGEGNLGKDCSGLLSVARTGQFIHDGAIIGRNHVRRTVVEGSYD